MANSEKFQTGVNKVVKWVEGKNWDVFFGDFPDEMTSSDRKITIHARLKKENQLYALLHECGHLIIQAKKNYKTKYPVRSAYLATHKKDKGLEKSKKYCVEEIGEEIEAWEEGWKLASRLGVKVDKKNFLNEKYKWVYTYVLWSRKE